LEEALTNEYEAAHVVSNCLLLPEKARQLLKSEESSLVYIAYGADGTVRLLTPGQWALEVLSNACEER
jgi:hypothetical protein